MFTKPSITHGTLYIEFSGSKMTLEPNPSLPQLKFMGIFALRKTLMLYPERLFVIGIDEPEPAFVSHKILTEGFRNF